MRVALAIQMDCSKREVWCVFGRVYSRLDCDVYVLELKLTETNRVSFTQCEVFMDDKHIAEQATREARARKKQFARIQVDALVSEPRPVSVFMAGSPGAGKTETARNMRELFTQQRGSSFIHIDNDELRKEFSAYKGSNSPLFQNAATIFVEAIHDRALKRNVSFIMDSTLSSYEKASSNIRRSLGKNRYVLIVFVYQPPEQAWQFVLAREAIEGRRVPADVFIEQFLQAQSTVNRLKQEFGSKIDLIFVNRNSDSSQGKIHLDVNDIDALLDKKYTRCELQALIEAARSRRLP